MGDHTVDASAGGVTSACNLADLCRRHHVLKHASPWTVEQIGLGRLRWTSPTGRVYTDEVPATLRFVPERVPSGLEGQALRVESAMAGPSLDSRGADPPPF